MKTVAALALTVGVLLLFSTEVQTLLIDSASANPHPYSPPKLAVSSPKQGSLYRSNVPLMLEVTLFGFWPPEGLNSLSYSLDGKPDIQIALTYPDVWGPETPLPFSDVLYGVVDGEHMLSIHGITSQGTAFGENRTFTVDNNAEQNNPSIPKISIVCPENKTYGSPDTHLTTLSFWVNEPFAWARYSLDGKANGTITGNSTLDECLIGEGAHRITMYTMDALGREASATSHFNILFSTYPGQLTLLSPQNRTYIGNVTLTFVKNGAVTYTVYILDNQTPTMLFENTTLSDLSLGTHSVVVQFGDIMGNQGNETVYFTVAETLPETFPTMPVAAASATSIATVGIGLAIYFRKRKHVGKLVS